VNRVSQHHHLIGIEAVGQFFIVPYGLPRVLFIDLSVQFLQVYDALLGFPLDSRNGLRSRRFWIPVGDKIRTAFLSTEERQNLPGVMRGATSSGREARRANAIVLFGPGLELH
jgi:hypothetical protein